MVNYIQKTKDKYIPGQCNIGKFEAERRLKLGVIGVLVTCALSFIFYVFAIDKFIIFILIYPFVFMASLGLYQYKYKFCVYYAINQVFNFENLINLTQIKSLKDQEKDKAKALEIIIYSLIIAFIYTVLYIILV